MQKIFGIVGLLLCLLAATTFSTYAQVRPFTNPYQNPYGATSKPAAPKPATTTTPTNNTGSANGSTSGDPDKKVKKNNKGTAQNGDKTTTGDKPPGSKEGTDVNLEDANAEDELTQNEDKANTDESEETLRLKQIAQRESSIYGQNFINAQTSDYSNNSNFTSPPSSYKLGIGDEIIVNVWGTSEYQENYTIGRDGSIFPRSVGKIQLAGLSFANAQQVVASRFRNILTNGSRIEVQLASVRLIKVTVMGEVQRPGTLTISAFNTAFNALSMAGGVTDLANLRAIEIKRGGRTVNMIDLYEFLVSGDIDDAYLEDGDIILIDVYEKKVKAEGKFKRPMVYLLKQEEDLTDLIRYSGGPTFDARFSSIQILTVADEQPSLYSINLKDIDAAGGTIALRDGDVVRIKPINQDVTNTITLQGAVLYPDQYQIAAGDRLLDVLNKAGGILPNALQNTAYVYRGDNTADGQSIRINIDSLNSNDYRSNLEIFPGDIINIISKTALMNQFTIEIGGEVRNPGEFKYLEGMTVRDLILLAGGMKPQAQFDRIEIARIIDTVESSYDFKILPGGRVEVLSYTLDPNPESNNNAANLRLRPLDKVYIRSKPDFKLTQVVYVAGEVMFPGAYPLLVTDEKLSSVITRAGGIKQTGFVNGARLGRVGIGEVYINLEEVMKSPSSPLDVFLKPGDTIYVPTAADLVAVKGAVQKEIFMKAQPTITDLNFYINSCGGYLDRAWRKKVYVQYPDGLSKKTTSFLGIIKHPPVTPGSIVIVPVKPEDKRGKWSWSESQGFILSMMSLVTSAVSTYVLIQSINKQP
ncbi:MAG: hypothetical protein RL660_2462 [Bacteroidota bacterium]|jgi:protein involved in polysaccharide export with SLBB domain